MIRRQNRHLLLEALRFHGPAPRVELGRLTSLSPATVTSITTQLLSEGYLREAEVKIEKPDTVRRGRPTIALELNPAAARVLSLKISIDRFELALADYSGTILARHTGKPTTYTMDRQQVGPLAARHVLDFLSANNVKPRQIRKLGIAVQGAAGSQSGHLAWSPAFIARDIPLVQPITEVTGIACSLANDANMIAEGLMAREHYQYKGNAAVVFMGYGVGMGLVIDGKAYHGATGAAAEFGHMNHVPGGALCRCGKAGCLEAYASDYGILRAAENLAADTPPPSHAVDPDVMRALENAARRGDIKAKAAYDTAGRAIGYGLARLIALLNPDRIVISGPGTAAFDLMVEAMHQAIEEGVVAELRQNITIETIAMDHDMIITGTIQKLLHELDRDVFASA
ncbi:MAG: ROK family transcriptional regulator [Aestuariivirga sp.]